jgi:quinol monooxygenase YgiN
VIVNYTSFLVRSDDLSGFDAWFSGLVDQARQEEGCVVYDFYPDLHEPRRRAVVAVWTSEETLAAHRIHPLHIEMVAHGASQWGIHDVRKHSWRNADGYSLRERDEVDSPDEGDVGRTAMDQLVREAQGTVRRSGRPSCA